jgi:N-acetylglucosamine kinase-like BadF-type ATPase
MTDQFLRRLGIADTADLIPKVYGNNLDRATIASLADAVTSADAAGDAIAQLILNSEAEWFAATAHAAVRDLASEESAPIPLALAGSVLTSCPSVADRFVAGLRNRGVNLGTIQPVEEPARGAIRLAIAVLP